VLDFGLAKLMEGGNEVSNDPQLTEVGVPYGTATYAAPEQAQGANVDQRADIFSTGVLLYEMLVGTWPFRGRTAVDVRYAVLHHTPQPLAEARSDTSPFFPRIQEILDRALAKEPHNRYQKVEELRQDLQRVLREIDGDTSLSNSPTTITPVPPHHLTPNESLVTKVLRHKKVAAGIGAVLLIGLLLAAYSLYFRPRNTTAFDSLAVLPFTNAAADPESEYLSDGITESLINSLSQLPYLKVRSRNTVFHYKGQAADAKKIGRELGVRALLSGRVVHNGNELAVSVELIDTQDDSQIWGARYTRKLSDIIALPEEIARDTADKLRLRLSGTEQKQLTKNYATNSEAYRLYLQGRYYWNRRTAEGLKQGIEYFNQVISKDPNYAPAYAGLADCYALLNVYNVAPATETYHKAQVAASKALELDESLAEAHTSLAFVKYRYYWDWAQAEQHFKRAIELKSDYATTHQWYSAFLAASGRHDESVAAAWRAHALEPFSLIIYADLVRHLYYARRYDEAIAECQKLIQTDAKFYRGHLELGQVLTQKGMHAEAVAEFEKALALSDSSVSAMSGLGHALALQGKRTEALNVIKNLGELSQKQYVSPYHSAVVYAGLGDKTQALIWLEKARDERFNWIPFIRIDPYFDKLRLDPQFTALVQNIKPG
jgi:TolB-like protein